MDHIGNAQPCYGKSQAMFKTLRRLHGHNLENEGLNNLSETFQNFMTRAKFFSLGRLRRTWSHSAVEFLKYRRLLPMLVADEHDSGAIFDNFNDTIDPLLFSSRNLRYDDRKITVTNVSNRATTSQIQSFFSKFGKIHSCTVQSEDRRHTMYATLPKTKKNLTVNITFKNEESAVRARKATLEELTFYGQQMTVSNFINPVTRNRTTSTDANKFNNSNSGSTGLNFFLDSSNNVSSRVFEEGANLSRSSSLVSISSNGTLNSMTASCSNSIFEELPARIIERIFVWLDPVDRVRLERVNKVWLEAAAKAWGSCERLSFSDADQLSLRALFNTSNPLRNFHLMAFLRRCGIHLKSLNLSGTVNLLDDKAIEDIAHHCPNLIELDISGLNVSSNALRSLSESLTKLKKISYRNITNVDERHFWGLFKSNAQNYSFIDLRGCVQLKGRCFKFFGSDLEELLLDGCRGIDDQVIEDICNRCTGIRILSLDGCNRLTDDSISLISRNLLDLNMLSLRGDRFTKISTQSLLNLSRLVSLRSIFLDYNSLVSNELLEAFVEGIPNLESLSIAFSGSDSSITETSLIKLGTLKYLIQLDVSGLAGVKNNFFKSLANSAHSLKKLVAQSCCYVGDEGVEELTKLKQIEVIDLSGCILVSNKSVQTLINSFVNKKDEQNIKIDASSIPLSPICLIIGGTICQPSQITLNKTTRIHVDFNDFSALNLKSDVCYFMDFSGISNKVDQRFDVDDNDEFELLSAHRSFIADALNSEDESPTLENDRAILEWAEREAVQLGLNLPKKSHK